MTEPLTERWSTRDLPVLRAIVQAFEEQEDPDVTEEAIAAATGLDQTQVESAIGNLERGGFVEATYGMGWTHVTNISERALRTTGVWPNEQQAADQLLWFLERKVEDAATPEDRGRWQRIRDSFGSAGRDFAVEVAAAMATRSMGG